MTFPETFPDFVVGLERGPEGKDAAVETTGEDEWTASFFQELFRDSDSGPDLGERSEWAFVGLVLGLSTVGCGEGSGDFALRSVVLLSARKVTRL